MHTPSPRSLAATAALLLGLLVIGADTAAANHHETSTDAAIRAAEAWTNSKAQSPDPSAPRVIASKPDPNKLLHVPGSTRGYTVGELSSMFTAADWFPLDHPPAPHVVLLGRKPAWACGVCHYPNGKGDTTSATLAGLPKAYILAQITAFRGGRRGKDGPPAAQEMAEEARHLDDADLQQAADYFSSLKLRLTRRVVESTTVPRTHWGQFVLAPDQDGAREPIGERIIEVSENQKLYDLGDERIGFVAYVPPGSIARGATIAVHGKGPVNACVACHGPQLHGQTLPGIGIVPPLAGRSPTYIVRQLIAFRRGWRTDAAAAPMRAEAAQLTLPEMIDVAAYAASRKP